MSETDGIAASFFGDEEIENSPSRVDGISKELEKIRRRKTCLLMTQICQHLQMKSQIVLARACNLFQRFYMFHSLKLHNRYIIGLACLFLAGKIEESPRKLYDYVVSFLFLKNGVKMKPMGQQPPELAQEISSNMEMVIAAERLVLHTICFDFRMEHPTRILFRKLMKDAKSELKTYLVDSKKDVVMKKSYHFLTVSYSTTLCLQYTALEIALGAFFLSVLNEESRPINIYKIGFKNSSSSTDLAAPNCLEDRVVIAVEWFNIISSDVPKENLTKICMTILEAHEPVKHSNVEIPQVAELHQQVVVFENTDTKRPIQSPSLAQIAVAPEQSIRHATNGSEAMEVDVTNPYPYGEESTRPSKKTVTKFNSKVNGATASSSQVSKKRPLNTMPSTPEHLPPPPPSIESLFKGEEFAPPIIPPTPDYLPPPPTDCIPPTPDVLPPPSVFSMGQVRNRSDSIPATPEYLPPPPPISRDNSIGDETFDMKMGGSGIDINTIDSSPHVKRSKFEDTIKTFC